MCKYTFGVRQIIVLECNKSSHKKEKGKKKWNCVSKNLLETQCYWSLGALCVTSEHKCSRTRMIRLVVYCPSYQAAYNIREIKLNVTWSYVKRQTAKMKLLPSVFSSLNSRVKIFVFVANTRGQFFIFMWFNEGLKEKNKNSEVIFAVCSLTLKTT